jgi:hypothetical protein
MYNTVLLFSRQQALFVEPSPQPAIVENVEGLI